MPEPAALVMAAGMLEDLSAAPEPTDCLTVAASAGLMVTSISSVPTSLPLFLIVAVTVMVAKPLVAAFASLPVKVTLEEVEETVPYSEFLETAHETEQLPAEPYLPLS